MLPVNFPFNFLPWYVPWSTVVRYDIDDMLGVADNGTAPILAGQINILEEICQWRRGKIVGRS